jgi:hypothetical protein
VRRQTVDRILPVAYALTAFAVVMAPSVAVWLAASRGGMGRGSGLDLVLASVLIGGWTAALGWRRLRDEERVAVRRGDIWIAALNALVVLAFGATLLLVLLLHGFAEEHSWMANRQYPVIALWAGIQLVAVLLAEGTGRLVFWWLEPRSTPASS